MRENDPLMDGAEAEARRSRQPGNSGGEMRASGDGSSDARLAWWREARFGMFVHWGPYSLLGGRWKGEEVQAAYAEHIQLRGRIPVREYEKAAAAMDMSGFHADEWVAAAKQAGMKYMIVTAKHHDGYAMYDSQASGYNIVRLGPSGRDPIRELSEACGRGGITFCLYYSHAMDWHHPDSQGNTLDYPDNIGAWDSLESWTGDEAKSRRYDRYLREKAFPQIRELLTNYGPVGILWFDCGHKITDEQGREFAELVRSIQPGCLINKRIRSDEFADYGNPGDNQLSVRVTRPDWESIFTLNDSWGFRHADRNWKTPEELIRILVETASRGGNTVFNVGPEGSGRIDDHSLRLLEEAGRWMAVHHASIRGTESSPIGRPEWGCCTANRQERKLFLHILRQPPGGRLIVPGIASPVTAIRWLHDPAAPAPRFRRLNGLDLLVELPGPLPDNASSVLVLQYEGELAADPHKRLMEEGATTFPAFDGEAAGERLRYDTGKKGRDNVTDWSRAGESLSWTFRAAAPGRYAVRLSYAAEPGVSGGSYTVCCGDHALRAEVVPTEGPYDFTVREIGGLEIPGPGTYTLTVRAEDIRGGYLMNLRQVVMKALTEEEKPHVQF
ncbi:alpha-L-fucosidase [Paenibacillus chitinolyticus]|uniref:alpha-L-fucosidase n=1 Tax=Paenibacillus chitinolyticus TaxID=79263 RepID=UPI0036DA3FFA